MQDGEGNYHRLNHVIVTSVYLQHYLYMYVIVICWGLLVVIHMQGNPVVGLVSVGLGLAAQLWQRQSDTLLES